jgi:alpha-1,2-mannosyltransferase
VLVVLCGVVVGFVVWQGGTTGLLDLRIYLGAVRGWQGGGSLYAFSDPTYHLSGTYPPIGLLGLAPLTVLPVRMAEVVWTLANLGAVAAIAWVVADRYLGLTGRRRALVVVAGTALAIPTAAVWTDLNQGQVNLWLWLAVLVDMAAVRRDRRWSGALIGVATAVKLVPGAFILFLLAIRRFGAAGRAVLVAAAATALGWLLAAPDSRSYVTSLLWDSSRVGAVDDGQNNSLRALLAHLGVSGPAQVGLWLVLAAAVGGFALVRAVRAWRAGQDLYAVLVVGCAAALVSPITWTHHLVFLALVLLLLPRPATATGRWLVLGAAWLFLVDPVGWGDSWLTGGLRSVAMVLVIAGIGIRPVTGPAPTAPVGRLATGPGVL